MKYGIVYVVMCEYEDEVEYASTDREEAEGYVENKKENEIRNVLNEWGNDDPTGKDIDEAAFQSGNNNKVVRVDISNRTEDDTVKVDDIEIEVSKILKKLRTRK